MTTVPREARNLHGEDAKLSLEDSQVEGSMLRSSVVRGPTRLGYRGSGVVNVGTPIDEEIFVVVFDTGGWLPEAVLPAL